MIKALRQGYETVIRTDLEKMMYFVHVYRRKPPETLYEAYTDELNNTLSLIGEKLDKLNEV